MLSNISTLIILFCLYFSVPLKLLLSVAEHLIQLCSENKMRIRETYNNNFYDIRIIPPPPPEDNCPLENPSPLPDNCSEDNPPPPRRYLLPPENTHINYNNITIQRDFSLLQINVFLKDI